MVTKDVAELISGYYCIVDHKNCCINDVLCFSPFNGSELSGGFLYELQFKISGILEERDQAEYERWCTMLYNMRPNFDTSYIPDDLKYLLTDKSWFLEEKTNERNEHKNGEFCGGLSVFIDGCYGIDYNPLPKLACVPIQYCPFCGIKLPSEFDQENWWEKEFKTFKWYKDHKMGEWADDYVDDCDWTEDDYPPTSNDKNSK